ncbi:hypothetical protein AVEN_184048-1 [Araneus ventricosus]|uniref:Uncharacterized protein n=1 Tax=Araneus ventricosus TaxID=182803 RepID=A0A4Y2DAJ3_ARAVE|nr:hypothetical protein AVEN_176997-1 [Araneus ventricosus]GBM13616.1 hypothetical protein AVEN_184048-1 [Araneus ventricosus]
MFDRVDRAVKRIRRSTSSPTTITESNADETLIAVLIIRVSASSVACLTMKFSASNFVFNILMRLSLFASFPWNLFCDTIGIIVSSKSMSTEAVLRDRRDRSAYLVLRFATPSGYPSNTIMALGVYFDRTYAT